VNAARSLSLLAVLTASAVLLVAPSTWDDPSQLLTRFAFHEPGQPPLILLRCAALYLSLFAARGSSWRTILLALLFVGSLIVRGLLLPLVGVATWFVWEAPPAEARVVAVADVLLAGALALALQPYLRPDAVTPAVQEPSRMVAQFRARQNPYEARWWALAWSRAETNGAGEGHLALADLDWQLERKAQARKVLEKVLRNPASEAARAQAEARLAEWGTEPSP
jgi:hypothetical protein